MNFEIYENSGKNIREIKATEEFRGKILWGMRKRGTAEKRTEFCKSRQGKEKHNEICWTWMQRLNIKRKGMEKKGKTEAQQKLKEKISEKSMLNKSKSQENTEVIKETKLT